MIRLFRHFWDEKGSPLAHYGPIIAGQATIKCPLAMRSGGALIFPLLLQQSRGIIRGPDCDHKLSSVEVYISTRFLFHAPHHAESR